MDPGTLPKEWTASYQAFIRLLRVWFAGAIAFLLTQIPDIVGVIDWSSFGQFGPHAQATAVLILTGAINAAGKLFREPTVPVSAVKLALTAPTDTPLITVAEADASKQEGAKVPI